MPTAYSTFSAYETDSKEDWEWPDAFERLLMLLPEPPLAEHFATVLERRYGKKLDHVLDLHKQLLDIETECGVPTHETTAIHIYFDYMTQDGYRHSCTVFLTGNDAKLAERMEWPAEAVRLITHQMRLLYMPSGFARHSASEPDSPRDKDTNLAFHLPQSAELREWAARVDLTLSGWMDTIVWSERIIADASAFDNQGIRANRTMMQRDVLLARRQTFYNALVPQWPTSEIRLRPETRDRIIGSPYANLLRTMIDQHYLLRGVSSVEAYNHPTQFTGPRRTKMKLRKSHT